MSPRFRKKALDTEALLIRISRGMTQSEDPSDYLKLLARIIENQLKVSHVGVLLYHQGRTAYVFHTSHGRQRVPAEFVKIKSTSPIVDWFRAKMPEGEGRPDFLSREHLERAERTEKDEEVLNEIKRLSSAICIPCFFREDLVGLILVGPKLDKRSFTDKEIQLLLILSHHAAIGVRSAELQNTAMTDELTGTYNRRAFIRRLGEELERARSYGHPVSLLMVDIDHFKHVNDRFGHTMGDSILRQLAILLSRHVRHVDVVCRYGGEEFSIILPAMAMPEAEMIAVRLQEVVAQEIWLIDQLTVSMGISSVSGTEPDVTPDRLIEWADRALYKAKMSGRNKVCLWKGKGTSLP